MSVYKAMIRPILKYACSVWGPHTKKRISMIKMGQRRAARFTLNRQNNTSCVEEMLKCWSGQLFNSVGKLLAS